MSADVGVVLVAHGDRAGADPNAALRAHAAALAASGRYAHAGFGLLRGEPTLESALGAASSRARDLVVVPLLMAEGYFTTRVLPDRIAATGRRVRLAPPLGLDPAIPPLLLTLAREAAAAAGLPVGGCDLMIVGHGSALGASARVPVERAVAALAGAGFVGVRPAFVEEAPFLGPAVAALMRPTVVASLLASDGLHGADDLDEALRAARVPVARTGALGRDARIRPILIDLVEAALARGDGALS